MSKHRYPYTNYQTYKQFATPILDACTTALNTSDSEVRVTLKSNAGYDEARTLLEEYISQCDCRSCIDWSRSNLFGVGNHLSGGKLEFINGSGLILKVEPQQKTG